MILGNRCKLYSFPPTILQTAHRHGTAKILLSTMYNFTTVKTSKVTTVLLAIWYTAYLSSQALPALDDVSWRFFCNRNPLFTTLRHCSTIIKNNWVIKNCCFVHCMGIQTFFFKISVDFWNVTKQNSKHYYNILYVVFMHGWLVQLELQGTWFLEVAQHQLVVLVQYSYSVSLSSYTVGALQSCTNIH